jgi:hypothetical protein
MGTGTYMFGLKKKSRYETGSAAKKVQRQKKIPPKKYL